MCRRRPGSNLADCTKELKVEAEGTQTKITLPLVAPDPIATVIRLDLRTKPVITTP